MSAIDRVKELLATASPGPWTWRTGAAIDKETGDKGHDPVVLDAHGNISGGPLIILSGQWEDDARDKSNVSLASLAPDLANLTAQMHEVLVTSTAGDYEQGEKVRAVFRAAEEFQEKYGND